MHTITVILRMFKGLGNGDCSSTKYKCILSQVSILHQHYCPPTPPPMPQKSYKAELLEKINQLELKVSESRRAYLQNEHNGLASDVDGESDNDFDMVITPPTPITPLLGSDSEADGDFTPLEQREQRYHCFLDAIHALQDEIQKARVLQPIGVPLLRSPQLHLLEHYADF